MTDAIEIPAGWGFVPRDVRELIRAETIRREPSPTKRRVMEIDHLLDQGCSWTEIERITGTNRHAYISMQRRNAVARADRANPKKQARRAA